MPAVDPSFLFGFGAGLSLLLILGMRPVSPGWLRGTLYAGAVLLLLRYAAIDLCPSGMIEEWTIAASWPAFTLGLSLPALFATDQLVRHPRMSPAQLIRFASPVIAIQIIALLWMTLATASTPSWVLMLSAVAGVASAAVVLALDARFALQMPAGPVRNGLWLLAAAQAALLLQAAGVAFGWWDPRLAAFDLVAVLLCWMGFDRITAARASF